MSQESVKKWNIEIEQEKVRHAFTQELVALLVKWNASIEAWDHCSEVRANGEDIRMEIMVSPVYIGGKLVRPAVDIDLGTYFYPELKEAP